MAQVTHTGNGDVSNTNNLGYSFTFPALSESEVQVSVNNVAKTVTTDYTIQNFSTAGSSNAYVLFTSTTARGTGTVRIYRQTDGNNLEHTFQAGSAIKADDLNKTNQQVLYLAEEAREAVNNLALGNSGSAVQINGSNIANDSITSQKIVNLEVKTEDINNLAVTTGKIADDAITTDKLANSINTTIAGKANTGANLSTFTNDSQFITLAQAFTTGMIMMFTGSTAPTGWALCDGTNGTPDLRNKFIVGVGSSYSLNATGGSATATDTVSISGSDTVNISISGTTSLDSAATLHSGAQFHHGGRHMREQHTHTFSGSGSDTVSISGSDTVNVDTIPPYYALSYIMKL